MSTKVTVNLEPGSNLTAVPASISNRLPYDFNLSNSRYPFTSMNFAHLLDKIIFLLEVYIHDNENQLE